MEKHRHLAGKIVLYLLRVGTLLLAVSILAFLLVSLSPIDPVQQYLLGAGNVSPEQRVQIAARWGLDAPPVQRYLLWLSAALRGDFGTSVLYRQPVLQLVGQKFFSSLVLMSVAWVVSGVLGFAAGCLMGMRRGRWADRILRRVSLFLCAVPAFWLGLLLLLVFAVLLRWFPVGFSAPVGVANAQVTLWQRLYHMILPACTLSLLSCGNVALHTRQKILDVYESDYVLFARARGESGRQIFWRHGLRNALLPALTLQFSAFAELFGGSVLVETVFSYPGLGSAAAAAGLGGDIPLLLGITLASTLFVYTGNTLANLIYQAVDPQMKERQAQ